MAKRAGEERELKRDEPEFQSRPRVPVFAVASMSDVFAN
jgi:hypothetical protein